jgi:hypothetical protein
MPTKSHYDFHGDPVRFPVVAEFISEHFPRKVRLVADVAGGQGMLARLLRKRLNLEAEVIDPRGHRMKNVPGHEAPFFAETASYYDLVVGLHPDQATQAIVKSALVTRTLIVPCCNFWDRSQRLGTPALLDAIEAFYRRHGVSYERVELAFAKPKNIAFVTHPPSHTVDWASVIVPSLDAPAGSARRDWLKEKTHSKDA